MNVRSMLVMVSTVFAFGLISVSGAEARQMIVRVAAPNYQTLYQHIPFKGSSIEISGVQPGKSYDLLLEEVDLGLVLSSGLKSEIVVFDLEAEKLKAGAFGFYCSYDSLVSIMHNWAATYPSICKFDSIGQTYEGRWVYALKISDNPQVEEDEPEVLLDAMHHSREWATPQAVRYFVDTLLRNYSTDSAFQRFIDNYQVWVVPVVNVDGYVYDYPAKRSWRKNRQPFGSSIGCDPNRNYNGVCNGDNMGDWGALVSGSQSSHLPSAATFMGGYGGWGKEVAAMQEFFKQHTFVANISLHSYSELVLWPYGYGAQTPDNAIFVNLGQRMAQQMQKLAGGNYTPEQSSQLYPTSGGSIDWMYGWAHYIGGFPCLSYVFEIGTTFYQDTSQLDAIQREVFKGVWYLFNRADSIIDVLEGMVPRPILAPMDSSATGVFTVHWSPIRPEQNHPEKWELEELSGLSVTLDSFESGSDRWTFQGAAFSTTQKHSGNYSVYLGTGNNISNYMVTADPYPVQPGDSLSYWIWYNTENNYDVVVTEVSLEGKEWIQLHDRYTGNSGGWLYKVYSLEPWAGKSVFIRFRYMTDDGTLGSGVYIDDVWPVPQFANRRTVSDYITDTVYEVSVSEPGQYWYRVRGYNAAWGWGDKGPLEDMVVTATGIASSPAKRLKTNLIVAGMNPSGSGVDIRYIVGSTGNVEIKVFDAAGRIARVLVSGKVSSGEYTVHWDANDRLGKRVPAGVYFCRLTADRQLTARMVLTR
ncbi:MAG: M14 family zinc carboxypeptidase [bacterium]